MSNEKRKTLEDVMVCPFCGSKNVEEYNIMSTQISEQGLGKYDIDCVCRSCERVFRIFTTFEYTITRVKVLKDAIY